MSWVRSIAEKVGRLEFSKLAVLTVVIQNELVDRFLGFRDDPDALRADAATWSPYLVHWLADNLDLLDARLQQKREEEVFDEVRRVLAAELAARGDDA